MVQWNDSVGHTLHLIGPDGKGLIEEKEIFQCEARKVGICLVNHLKSGNRRSNALHAVLPMITILLSCFLCTHKFDDVSSVPLHNCKCGNTKKRLKNYVWVFCSEVYQLQQQKKPLLALRVKHLRVKVVPCTKFVDCIHENQALGKEGEVLVPT